MSATTRITLVLTVLLIVGGVPNAVAQQTHVHRLATVHPERSSLGGEIHPSYASKSLLLSTGAFQERLRVAQERAAGERERQKKSAKLTRAEIARIMLVRESDRSSEENQRLESVVLAGDRSPQTSGEEGNWWDSWGQCTAGTVGPAMLVGLAGGGYADEAPYSATVGAILGVVGGGLLGLSSFCL